MRRYTDAEFSMALATFMNRGAFHRSLVGHSFMVAKENSIYKRMVALDLELVWVAVMLHTISQNGVDAAYVAVEDDVLLTEMFDFHRTGEGWAFWDAINSLVR